IGFQKRLGPLFKFTDGLCRLRRVGHQFALQFGPTGKPVFERERSLHISQARLRRRIRHNSFEAGASFRLVLPKRDEPALGLLFQTFERAAAEMGFAHETLPPMCLKSAECRLEESVVLYSRIELGGKIPLPRTGGAPMHTVRMLAPGPSPVKCHEV